MTNWFERVDIFLNLPLLVKQAVIAFAEDSELLRTALKNAYSFNYFSQPKYLMSTRRLDREGFFSLVKKIGIIFYHLYIIKKPITEKKFEYKMGGHQ